MYSVEQTWKSMSESCNFDLEAAGIYRQGDTHAFISKVPDKLGGHKHAMLLFEIVLI